MDLSGPMGIDLASFIVVKDKFRSLDFQSKRSFEGHVNPNLFKTAFRVDLNYEDLLNLMYEGNENKRSLKTKDFLMVIVIKNYEVMDKITGQQKSDPFQLPIPEGFQKNFIN